MAYFANNESGVVAFDVGTMAIVESIDMTGIAPQSRGISIDFDGYVWMIDQTDSVMGNVIALIVDPRGPGHTQLHPYKRATSAYTQQVDDRWRKRIYIFS